MSFDEHHLALPLLTSFEHVVSAGNFDDFLHEAVSAEPDCDKGLNCEELFGLYTSWCLLGDMSR